MLSNQQFERARRLALSLAGIQLVDRHRELLERRSRRLDILNAAAFEALLAAAEAGDTHETQMFLGLLTTRFTRFFRHPQHFEIAARHAVQVAGSHRRARLWSAGTATGEEAWSLAMAMIEGFERENPPVNILASDVDIEALAVAERGQYGELSLKTLSPERRRRFLCTAASQTTPAGTMECCGSTQLSLSNTRWVFEVSSPSETESSIQPPHSKMPTRHTRRQSKLEPFRIAPVVRRLVEFRPVNLADTEWPVQGPFDVIFCRNVLMYLEAGHRYAVLERMASLLSPGALLLLDPAEHSGNAEHWFAPLADGVYSRRSAPCPPHREQNLAVSHP